MSSLGDHCVDQQFCIDVGEESLVIGTGMPSEPHSGEIITDPLDLIEADLDCDGAFKPGELYLLGSALDVSDRKSGRAGTETIGLGESCAHDLERK